MMLTLETFKENWKSFCHQQALVIALSGGVDSIVLLHLLKSLKSQGAGFSLRAIHINHQLSPAADDWSQHCLSICSLWNVDYETYRVNVDLGLGIGLEAAARKVRYQALIDHCLPGESLVTAHHEMDQVETVLLQLVRGAGVRGLSGMSAESRLNGCDILRPLLSVSRDNIENYAKVNQLGWVEDSSNYNVMFDRNYMRYQVLPKLQERWSASLQTIARSAHHCSGVSSLLDYYLGEDLQLIKQGNQLSVSSFLSMPTLKHSHLLRAWLVDQGAPLPDTHQLEVMVSDVICAKNDAMPCLHWKGYELRRYDDLLYVMPKLGDFDSTSSYIWDLQDDLFIEPLGVTLYAQSEAVLWIKERYPSELVRVHFRQGGEKLHRGDHHQSLRKYFQQQRIPPWLRGRVPLLTVRNKLVFVWFSQNESDLCRSSI